MYIVYLWLTLENTSSFGQLYTTEDFLNFLKFEKFGFAYENKQNKKINI